MKSIDAYIAKLEGVIIMSDLRITSSSLLAQATNNGSKNKITENDSYEKIAAAQSGNVTTASTGASQGSNNKLGLSDEEYTRYFYFATDLSTGKGIYFPPADAPVEEQKAWYEQMSKLSAGERAVYHVNAGCAVMYGTYYRPFDAVVDNSYGPEMINRLKELGVKGTLKTIAAAQEQLLSDNIAGGNELKYIEQMQRMLGATKNVLLQLGATKNGSV